MSKTIKTNESSLTKTLMSAVQAAKKIEDEAHAERERLEKALRLARGTGDVHEQAAAAKQAAHKSNGHATNGHATVAKPRTLAGQIEHALRAHGLLSEVALARTLGVGPRKLAEEMRSLKLRGKVYNIGSEDHPRWCWIIGDDSSPAELNEQVYRLTSAAPLTFNQLQAATGARRGRVSGAIVHMQRDKSIAPRIENLGNGRVFVWFVRPSKNER